MKLEEIVELFKDKEYYKRMGKGKLSKQLGCTTDDIKRAKRLAYDIYNNAHKTPKVLFLDIETSLIEGYFWSLFEAPINIKQIKHDKFILCYAAKWLFESEFFTDCVTSVEAKEKNDKRILVSLSNLLNQADIVVTHNGNNFDLPIINSRLFLNNLNPVRPFQSIDTYQSAKRVLKLTSNKLDYLATVLKLENKKPTGIQLWIDCMNGDKVALAYMQNYNKGDVEILEDVYIKMRPWIKNHPNMALYMEADTLICPNCGSTSLKESGFYYTLTQKYKVYQCDCGAFCRVRTTALEKEERQYILTNNLR